MRSGNAEFARSIVQRLDRLDTTGLSEDDRLTFEILRWENQLAVDGLPYFWYRFQVAPYSFRGLGTQQIFTMQRLNDAERSRLLAELPRVVDQMIEVLRQQRERGITLPKAEVSLAKQAISGAIPDNPSLQRLADSISEANAPESIRLAQYPGGEAAYRYFVRARTTVDMAPQQIHDLGLREVERINGEMQRVRDELGFKGTKAEFHQFLKSDPRFFARTPEEVGDRLTRYLHRIDARSSVFLTRAESCLRR